MNIAINAHRKLWGGPRQQRYLGRSSGRVKGRLLAYWDAGQGWVPTMRCSQWSLLWRLFGTIAHEVGASWTRSPAGGPVYLPQPQAGDGGWGSRFILLAGFMVR